MQPNNDPYMDIEYDAGRVIISNFDQKLLG